MAEPNFLGALRDPEFRAQVKQGLKDAANRGVASFFGGPVDLASMVMRPFGYSTPDREVVGGSEWIGKQMEQRGMVSEARNPVAEFLAAVALPAGMTKAAPGIFRTEQKAIQNAMTPSLINDSTRRQAGIFIGPSAKTWDKNAAKKAEKMLADGVDPKQVWKETGTFKGADGALRQEIDDSVADFPVVKKYRRSDLDASVVHEPLEAAYPDVKGIQIEFTPGGTLSGGEYRPNVQFHDIGPRESIVLRNSDLSRQSNKSIGLHEIQHAIQQREGWARGGSPESMALDQIIDPRFSEGLTRWNKTIGKYGYPKDKMFQPDDIKMNDPELLMRELQGQARWLEDGMGKYVPDFDNAFPPGVTPFSLNAEEAYRRLAGEAEARATQARMNMNADQRRMMFPFDSYDVPLDQLIIRR